MCDKLSDRIKSLRIYAQYKIPPEMYFAIMLDGRYFSQVTARMNCEKPYDTNFKQTMVSITKGLVGEYNALIGYTQSDEISVVFRKEEDIFNRRLEKIISDLSSYFGCKFTQEANITDEVIRVHSTVYVLPTEEHVVDYLHLRHIDAVRNGLNS